MSYWFSWQLLLGNWICMRKYSVSIQWYSYTVYTVYVHYSIYVLQMYCRFDTFAICICRLYLYLWSHEEQKHKPAYRHQRLYQNIKKYVQAIGKRFQSKYNNFHTKKAEFENVVCNMAAILPRPQVCLIAAWHTWINYTIERICVILSNFV